MLNVHEGSSQSCFSRPRVTRLLSIEPIPNNPVGVERFQTRRIDIMPNIQVLLHPAHLESKNI